MKTPEEIIDDAWSSGDAVCGHDMVQELDAAGFAIVPKEDICGHVWILDPPHRMCSKCGQKKSPQPEG